MAPSLFTAFDDKKFFTNQKCFIITSDTINLKFIYSLFSSKVLNFVFKLMGSPLGTGGYDINKYFVEELPIVFNNELEGQIIELTEKSIELNNLLNDDSVPPNKKIVLQQQLNVVDKEIEQLIYQLYNLADDEIAIIEEVVGE